MGGECLSARFDGFNKGEDSQLQSAEICFRAHALLV